VTFDFTHDNRPASSPSGTDSPATVS
jgi:hypothetical protein